VAASGFGFSRDELLSGLPARRASTLLFALESRTALLVARDRRAMATFETEQTEADKEGAFMAALGEGRTPPLKPTIQDLDRHAADWADLLPPDAEGRAAVLRRIVDKYGLPHEAATARRVLGVDDPAVAAAFARQANATIESLTSMPLPARERWRWFQSRAAARIEGLPAFWLALALTLTETVGGGILALPIAFAGLGVWAAAALLVVFGIVNVLTVAALVEGITRNGNMRYGSSYFGRLVGDYLGRPGNAVLTPALFLLNAVGFVVALVGFGSTLAGATGLPIGGWAALLFAVNLVFLWRGSFNATVASALLVGVVNIALITAISLLALTAVPPGAGAFPTVSIDHLSVDASAMELVFGVALMAYFGHTSAGNAAKVVLARDPSGQALLWGNVAAMLGAMALYILAVVAIGLALGGGELVCYAGTAITPLAARVGPIVNVLGSVYVVLAVGLGSIYLSLSLFNQMAELVPSMAVRATAGASVRSRIPGFVVRAGPLALIFVAVEVLVASGSISFTGPLSIVGTLTLPLLGGIFPMLMLVAARRKGDRIPGRVIGLLGNRVVVAAIIGVFFLAELSYGLFIWTGPVERTLALLVAAAVPVVWLVSWRRGAFRSRTVIELRSEPGPPERGILTVTAAGRPLVTELALADGGDQRRATASSVTIADPGRLRSFEVVLPSAGTAELKIWAHRVSREGDSTAIPGRILGAGGSHPLDVSLSARDGQVITDSPGGAIRMDLSPTTGPAAARWTAGREDEGAG
jgi:amino acid permease